MTDQDAADAISLATARILCGPKPTDAFYATLLIRMKPIPTRDVATAATDGRRLLYNPEWIHDLDQSQLNGLLRHLCMHVAHLHHVRRGKRNKEGWNLGCDLAVNEIIKEDLGTLPPDAPLPGIGKFRKHPIDETAERHYELLKGGYGYSSYGDVIDAEDIDKETEAATLAVAQGAHAAARRGELPAGLQRLVGGMFAPPKANWRDILRQFVANHARNDYCWLTPNRKLVQQGVYAPGLWSEELGDVLVAIDTSGSIDDAQLKDFAIEVEGVLSAYDCSATIIYCDAAVGRVDTWQTGAGQLTFNPVGGGGTSHRPIWKWCADNQYEPVCAICLTDMETDFGEAPPFPVLWASTGHADAPWGQVVKL